MQAVLDWAVSKKGDLLKLQSLYGIPAMWAAAQSCHESYDPNTHGLTELAAGNHNWGGLKFAPWMKEYGCTPAEYWTWEEVDGTAQRVKAQFCACPSPQVWLEVYAALLMSETYSHALAYVADPLLYGAAVGEKWATDSRYVGKVATWMMELYSNFADTIPSPPRPAVPVVDTSGRSLVDGWLQDGQTVVRVRDLADGMGLQTVWTPKPMKVQLKWPGAKR